MSDQDPQPDVETKEWVKVSRAPNGKSALSVTLQRGNITSRWATQTAGLGLKGALSEARSYARKNLVEIEALMDELDG